MIKRNRDVQITKWVSVIMLTLVFLLFCLFSYWVLSGKDPIYAENADPKVFDISGQETNIFKPGDLMYIERTFCKSQAISGLVRRSFENDSITTLPNIMSRNEPGCGTHRFGIPIPIHLPPGDYTFRTNTKYDVNPIVTRTHEWTPIHVTVIPRE